MLRILIRNISKDPILYEDSLSPSLQYLFKIFGHDRRPPSHVLGLEVLYFVKSEKLYKCIGMSEDWPIHKNITLMHFSLLNQRLQYEETKESLRESARLFELCERYLFERYLDLVETLIDLPVAEFECELVEMIIKDFINLDNDIACYGYNKPFIVLEERPGYNIMGVIMNQIFENKIAPTDPQVKLMLDYFLHHKKYLEGLSYYQLLNEKVEWGKGFIEE